MATIYYNIDSGNQPFTASINPAVASDNIHTSTGSFYFTNIPDGEYSITIVDSVGCQAIFGASVYCSTTTTTTGIPTTTTTTLPPTTTTTTLPPTTTTTTTLPPTTTTTTTLCNVAKYSPDNRDTWCSYDFYHNGGCVNISDKQLNPLYLDNVDIAITEYCQNEKSYSQTASGRNPFYLTEGKTIEVGDPVYKFGLINNCELNEETFTTLLTTGISPCGLRNVVAIRVAGGYIIEKRTLFVK